MLPWIFVSTQSWGLPFHFEAQSFAPDSLVPNLSDSQATIPHSAPQGVMPVTYKLSNNASLSSNASVSSSFSLLPEMPSTFNQVTIDRQIPVYAAVTSGLGQPPTTGGETLQVPHSDAPQLSATSSTADTCSGRPNDAPQLSLTLSAPNTCSGHPNDAPQLSAISSAPNTCSGHPNDAPQLSPTPPASNPSSGRPDDAPQLSPTPPASNPSSGRPNDAPLLSPTPPASYPSSGRPNNAPLLSLMLPADVAFGFNASNVSVPPLAAAMSTPPPSAPSAPAQALAPQPDQIEAKTLGPDQLTAPNEKRRSHRPVVPNKWVERKNEIGTNIPKATPGQENDLPGGPPQWIDAAKAYLLSCDFGAGWVTCIQSWVLLEEQMGYGTLPGCKGHLAVAQRPDEWARWLTKSKNGVRPYGSVPGLKDAAEFGVALEKWWHGLQPSFRRSPSGGPLPIYVNPSPAAGGDDWKNLRKAGPNGLVSVLTMLSWWGKGLATQTQWQDDSSPAWKAMVNDITLSFQSISASVARITKKRKGENGKKEGKEGLKRARSG